MTDVEETVENKRKNKLNVISFKEMLNNPTVQINVILSYFPKILLCSSQTSRSIMRATAYKIRAYVRLVYSQASFFIQPRSNGVISGGMDVQRHLHSILLRLSSNTCRCTVEIREAHFQNKRHSVRINYRYSNFPL